MCLYTRGRHRENSSLRTVSSDTLEKLDFHNIFRECQITIQPKNVKFITDKIPMEHFSPILNHLSNIARGYNTYLYVEPTFDSHNANMKGSVEDDRDIIKNPSNVYVHDDYYIQSSKDKQILVL
jgi:hypothetical protein